MSEIDPNAHRILKALLTWDVSRHGRPSTWDLGRGTGRGAITVSRALNAMQVSGLAENTGRDRDGARLWCLTPQGEEFARAALSSPAPTEEG